MSETLTGFEQVFTFFDIRESYIDIFPEGRSAGSCLASLPKTGMQKEITYVVMYVGLLL